MGREGVFSAALVLMVLCDVVSAATLFEDHFDTSPCGRWGIYYDDWTDAGCTVYHATDYGDGCGRTPQGYAYRQYAG